MYRGNCPELKPHVNALGRRLRTLRRAQRPRPSPTTSARTRATREVQDEAEIVWSAPADAEDDEGTGGAEEALRLRQGRRPALP